MKEGYSDYPAERCFKVKKLFIKKFRRISSQTIEVGPNITLIVGQNGTSKSTLLGLIAHPFSTKNDKNSVYVRHYGDALENLKTINGKTFTADYRQMFRMEKGFDKPGDHEYSISLSGPGLISTDELGTIEIPIRSRTRSSTQNQIRLVAGKTHQAGEGNFPHPVIYLGLGRLAPLAECKKILVQESRTVLTDEEATWLHKKNSEILSLNESPVGIDIVNSGIPSKGTFPASSYKDYNPATYSAGQDNLGQILIALLSFRRLKRDLGDKYAGGILFVDELDAALFPSAQTRLLDVLAEESLLLGIQIIATTHSVTMMHYVFHSRQKKCTRIVFLNRVDNNVVVVPDATYVILKNNLLIEHNSAEKPALFFEDELALTFFKVITSNLFNEDYCLECIGSSGGIKQIATNEQIQKRLLAVAVLDADCQGSCCSKNIVFLPGKKQPLETEIYFFLKELSDADEFWDTNTGFTRQFLFKGEQYEEHEKKNIKEWFSSKKESEWGRYGQHALERWVKDHYDLCGKFCDELIAAIEGTVPTAPKLNDIRAALQKVYNRNGSHQEKSAVDIEELPLFMYPKA